MEQLTFYSELHTVGPMDQNEQAVHFANDLDKLIDRYRQEYDILNCVIIGLLHTEIHALISDSLDDDD